MLNEIKNAELNEQELTAIAGGDWLDDLKEFGNNTLQKVENALGNTVENVKEGVKTILDIVTPLFPAPVLVPEIPAPMFPDNPIVTIRVDD
ncbi:MAG: hypothetical protein CW338_08445 [Clostridiales bacterium]|nr:hypothetical protein [Clostridiales bacterium]